MEKKEIRKKYYQDCVTNICAIFYVSKINRYNIMKYGTTHICRQLRSFASLRSIPYLFNQRRTGSVEPIQENRLNIPAILHFPSLYSSKICGASEKRSGCIGIAIVKELPQLTYRYVQINLEITFATIEDRLLNTEHALRRRAAKVTDHLRLALFMRNARPSAIVSCGK